MVMLHAYRRRAIVVTDRPKLNARPDACYGYDYCIGYAPGAQSVIARCISALPGSVVSMLITRVGLGGTLHLVSALKRDRGPSAVQRTPHAFDI
jgi:hypothetical protein